MEDELKHEQQQQKHIPGQGGIWSRLASDVGRLPGTSSGYHAPPSYPIKRLISGRDFTRLLVQRD